MSCWTNSALLEPLEAWKCTETHRPTHKVNSLPVSSSAVPVWAITSSSDRDRESDKDELNAQPSHSLTTIMIVVCHVLWLVALSLCLFCLFVCLCLHTDQKRSQNTWCIVHEQHLWDRITLCMYIYVYMCVCFVESPVWPERSVA